MASGARGAWSEWPVDHFLRTGHIGARDGAAVRWFHAANSRARAAEAARSDVHMVEADVLLRGGRGDPILAHPPDTDSDITLQEWLAEMVSTNKGIKLDFKSLGAVGPSLELLSRLRRALERPVWLNGDVLPGPRGGRPPLDARAFLAAVASSCPAATLSLGWTTGCHRGQGLFPMPMPPLLLVPAGRFCPAPPAVSLQGSVITGPVLCLRPRSERRFCPQATRGPWCRRCPGCASRCPSP
ncbi:protein FAM151B isoform X2 [Corvus moneduloides]|uniref:protein FAM151B isoform X2 n=1 Tax=Corvus moneduloides TaxID=1196302 RepID=UPI001362D7D6|nr:protein FAM151B isoform X2 [Corvus moneduloides]